MNHNHSKRTWNILCWNVRGINSDKKCNSIRDKIIESHCHMICLQETKREQLDTMFLRKFCPPSFDKFEFSPSQGASGGLAVIWNSRFFDGELVFSNNYA